MSTHFKETWERYVSSWKAEGAAKKRALFEGCLDSACVYTDPIACVSGWDSLLEYMLQFHEQSPGAHFVTTQFFAHNDRSIARWNLVGADGTVLGDGMSYGEYRPDGMLKTMTGFFDPPQ